MDNQQIFNVVVTLAGFFGGYILSSITRQITRLDDRIGEIPMLFVTKDDYRADIGEIKTMLIEIRREIQHKVDKQ